MQSQSKLSTILEQDQSALVEEWLHEQSAYSAPGPGITRLMDQNQIRRECEEFLELLSQATRVTLSDIDDPAFRPVMGMLARLSRTRGERGFLPSHTASFVLSLKRPLFARLRKEHEHNPAAQADGTWAATELLDRLALYTTEIFQQSREEVIRRQQQDMLELSTPVVKLWDGILALPLIGTLDSNRTQIVMETLLQRVVETESEIAIIDITGVSMVDTLVAQHIMKTVAAARLMGVDCIISGIRPQIAQTIVHLALDLGNIITKATLADAFRIALQRVGSSIVNKTADLR